MSDDQPLAITDLHLRTLLDASPVGMLVFNAREEIILANQPAERLFGLGTLPLPTDRCGDLIRCANRLTTSKGCGHAVACTTCPLLRGLQATIAGTTTPTDQEGETLLDREPGCAPLWVRYRIRPLIIDSKRGALLTVDDITAQRLSEQQYTTLFREMLNAFALHEILCDDQGRPVDYRFLAVNPAFERMTGLCAEQVVGRTVLEVVPGIEPFWIETYGRVALTGEPVHFQHYSREIDKHFSINAFCPTPGHFACLFEDITDRKESEEAIREQEAFLRSITSSTRDAILVIDNNGHISFWNPAAELIFGYTAEEALGAHLHRLLAPQRYHQAYEQAFTAFQQTGEGNAIGRTIELEARHKSDQEFPIALSLSAFHSAKGWHTVGVIRDITERKKVEESLRESEERFKALHNASFGGIAIHDQGVILECNQGLSELSGFSKEELIGMDGLLLISEKTRGKVLENIRAGYEKPYEAIGLRKNNDEYPLRLEARNIPYKGKRVRVVEFRDLTEAKQMEAEREKLQAQLQQAYKMEAIGTLAGGIAHDFNNILGAVIGYTEMAREDSPGESLAATYMDKVLEASNRAKNLVRQILAFSRQENIEPVLLDPEIIVKEAAALLRPSLPTTIAIEVEVESGVPAVMADPTQLHQIVINLATNAFHAMEATGGTLRLSLNTVDWRRQTPPAFPESRPGLFVCLAVEDTGPGIPTAIRERIFEPFFTTKEVGRGTGMGLATVHGIVQKCGGFIICESEPGHGATFKVFLPAITSGSTSQPPQEAMGETDRTGKGHILFVDDEQILVEMGQTLLERMGYQVTTRTSSLDALATFQSDPHQFDAVITDQTMPGLTGLDLARQMLQIRPDLPIILCTGYSKLVDEDQARACGIRGFAMKPLTKKDMATLLREVLDDSKTRA